MEGTSRTWDWPVVLINNCWGNAVVELRPGWDRLSSSVPLQGQTDCSATQTARPHRPPFHSRKIFWLTGKYFDLFFQLTQCAEFFSCPALWLSDLTPPWWGEAGEKTLWLRAGAVDWAESLSAALLDLLTTVRSPPSVFSGRRVQPSSQSYHIPSRSSILDPFLS